jgi:hypothetical protein
MQLPFGDRCYRKPLLIMAGLDLIDTSALPKGITVCNVFGHELAIADTGQC